MTNERYFLDTVFIQALLNKRDWYHQSALQLLPKVKAASEVYLTEAILMEVGNALSAINRQAATNFIQQCYNTPNIKVVSVDSLLFQRALEIYSSRNDKTWGLTDCISFVVMQEQNLTDALTADRHFVQAGYRALMLE